MKLRYQISNLGKQDLENIWKFTNENWSVNQANKYFEGIIDQINLITENPGIGKSIELINKGSRVTKYKSHIIIYKVNEDTIKIDRILHRKMNIKKWLK